MSTRKISLKSVGWQAAIEDAQKRIQKLRGVIAVCEEKKAKGEPWPGDLRDLEEQQKSPQEGGQ